MGFVIWAVGLPERMQSRVDELGCTLDVVGDDVMNNSGYVGAVQVSPQALGLDAPQPDQSGSCDLWLGIFRKRSSPPGQDLSGHGDELFSHLILMSPQRGCGTDHGAEPLEQRADRYRVVLRHQPGNQATQFVGQDL
jgi:hypothetical protein